MVTDPDFLHTQREYARQRRCSQRTVERERANGTGCPFVKIGRAVRYRQRDIVDFIERHLRRSTSEVPGVVAPHGARRETNGCDPLCAPKACLKKADDASR
jgi:hypothetical protein